MNKKSVNSQKIVIVTGIENCENNALSIRSFKKLGDFSPSCVRIAFFGNFQVYRRRERDAMRVVSCFEKIHARR